MITVKLFCNDYFFFRKNSYILSHPYQQLSEPIIVCLVVKLVVFVCLLNASDERNKILGTLDCIVNHGESKTG